MTDRPPTSGEPSTERMLAALSEAYAEADNATEFMDEIAPDLWSQLVYTALVSRGYVLAEARATPAELDMAIEALRAITRTVYSDAAPLDSPSYSSLHLQAVGIAREALARLSASGEQTDD